MLRRLFITFGFAVFLVYCWASVHYQNQVSVPGYRTVSVDVLGKGQTRAQWDADTQGQFQRLMQLESAKYQLPEDAKVPAPPADAKRPGAMDADGNISPEHPLSADDYTFMIADLEPDQGLVMQLRDTSAINGLANKNYLLRDPVMRPGDAPDAKPMYNYADPVDKDMIDGLIRSGVGVITVTGHGSPVSYEVGTALMIVVIFLTLVAALKPLLWDPFRAMLDRRRQELDSGSMAERRNQEDEAKLTEAKKTENAKLLRDLDDLRRRIQVDAERRAGDVLKEAQDREKGVKLEGLRRLGDSADTAKRGLDRQVPELAELIADAVMPGKAAGGADRNDG